MGVIDSVIDALRPELRLLQRILELGYIMSSSCAHSVI